MTGRPPRPLPAPGQNRVDQPEETAWASFMARHLFDDIDADTLAREEAPPDEASAPQNE
jgi:hypothetical protein